LSLGRRPKGWRFQAAPRTDLRCCSQRIAVGRLTPHLRPTSAWEIPPAQESHPLTPPLFHSVEIPLGLVAHAGRVCYSFIESKSHQSSALKAREIKSCTACFGSLPS
jgi:hypothetical protein